MNTIHLLNHHQGYKNSVRDVDIAIAKSLKNKNVVFVFNGYLTPRGKVFKNTHVFSILKKRRIREERSNRPYELTFGGWYEKEV